MALVPSQTKTSTPPISEAHQAHQARLEAAASHPRPMGWESLAKKRKKPGHLPRRVATSNGSNCISSIFKKTIFRIEIRGGFHLLANPCLRELKMKQRMQVLLHQAHAVEFFEDVPHGQTLQWKEAKSKSGGHWPIKQRQPSIVSPWQSQNLCTSALRGPYNKMFLDVFEFDIFVLPCFISLFLFGFWACWAPFILWNPSTKKNSKRTDAIHRMEELLAQTSHRNASNNFGIIPFRAFSFQFISLSACNTWMQCKSPRTPWIV